MKRKYFAFLIMVCSACEMVVDVDVPVEAPRITLNATFSSDSTWVVNLIKSKYVLDEGQYHPVENAQVVIKENGVAIETLTHQQYGMYVSAAGNKPTIGNTYDIEVTAPGMETVNAQSSLPSPPPPMTNVVFTWRESSGSINQGYNYTIDVKFRDNENSEDFYEFVLFQESTYVNWQTGDTMRITHPVHIYSDDTMFSPEGVNGILFDDKIVNGKEVALTIKGLDYNGRESKFFLTMRTLGKDLYQYRVTTELQNFNSGDPFAQPVHVYNNIRNGFGIFAGYSETRVQVTE